MIEDFLESLDLTLNKLGYKKEKDRFGHVEYSKGIEISINFDDIPSIKFCKENECLEGYLTKFGEFKVFVDNYGNLIYGDNINVENELYKIINLTMRSINYN